MKYKIGFGKNEIGEIEKFFNSTNIDWEIVENPRAKIVESAEKNIGKPYKYGASVSKDAPVFFDCSSFTNWLYVQAGITLPRISVDQYVFSEEVGKENAKAGDLIFSNSHRDVRGIFHNKSKEFKPGTPVPKFIDHCGIYLGTHVIHANEKTGCVVKEKISESEYFQDIVSIRKVKEADEARYIVILE
jgi:cell wall-associated NlpC family hydrolase